VTHFFLSHARADADPYFETFYRDFIEELRGKVGAPNVDGLGFRDTEDIALGALWRPEIERALLESRTFLAMLSPTYIKRPACAKEWAGFEWRLRRQGGAATALLLPLVWIPTPPGDLPAVVQARQFAHAALGRTYVTHGLRVVVQRAGT
jgi:hypothetical protein